jgi:protocatechuate 3,4-dioxygenase beta subunit
MSAILGRLTTITLTAILCSPGLCLFAQQSTSTESAGGHDKQVCTISGSVVRAGTNDPLAKARVVLISEDDSSTPPYLAITGTEGRFTIEGIRAGRYDLYVERSGYMRKSYGENNQGNSSAILSLKPAQRLTDLIFRLQRYGAISGRVLDDNGEPAEGISVEVLHRSTSHGKVNTSTVREAQTNDLGEYRIFDLWPGRYLVRASPSQGSGQIIGGTLLENSILKSEGGYAPTYYPNVSGISRAAPVELKVGEEVSHIDLMLLRQRTFKVRGRVFNGVTNHPHGQTDVGLVTEDSDSSTLIDARAGSANENTGDFEIKDVPVGRYVAIARWRDGENEFVGSVPFEVTDMDVDSIHIVINRGVDLHGRVIVQGKVAVAVPAEIQVTITAKDSWQLGSNRRARVKPDGTFLLTGLADGIYEFDVWSRCEGCYLRAATANGQDILDQGLQISSGVAPSPIELVYNSNSATIDGTVLREDGLPASGATVILVLDQLRHRRHLDYREGSTDQYGHFIIRGVPPGAYHVYSWQSIDYADYTDPEFLKLFEKKAQTISIDESEQKSLQLSVLSAPNDRQ